MGYHFLTIEALMCDDPGKNFIKLQHKGGGASANRRIRRIALLANILENMGFEHHTKLDVLDSNISYVSRDKVESKLKLLGKLTLMTKQLDMALSNDQIAEWYTSDFKKQLGLMN